MNADARRVSHAATNLFKSLLIGGTMAQPPFCVIAGGRAFQEAVGSALEVGEVFTLRRRARISNGKPMKLPHSQGSIRDRAGDRRPDRAARHLPLGILCAFLIISQLITYTPHS
jgi:hypothetical protein